MHQLSFPAFAAAQQAPAPVLPVRYGCPLRLQRIRAMGDLRFDWYCFDDYGYSLDATRYIPVGGHENVDLDECVYITGHELRAW